MEKEGRMDMTEEIGEREICSRRRIMSVLGVPVLLLTFLYIMRA